MEPCSKDMNGHWFSKLAIIVLWVLAVSLVLPSAAFAYVDPGSGSVIVTAILGLCAAVGYNFRKYFYKIKRSITGEKPLDEKHQENQVKKK